MAYAQKIANAAGLENPTICRLNASNQTLLTRVRMREIGSNLKWHEERSLELSSQMAEQTFEDFVVETDALSVTEIAAEIVGAVQWCQ